MVRCVFWSEKYGTLLCHIPWTVPTLAGYLQQYTEHVSNYWSYWAKLLTCKVMKYHVMVTINQFKRSNIKILKLLTVNTVTPSYDIFGKIKQIKLITQENALQGTAWKYYIVIINWNWHLLYLNIIPCTKTIHFHHQTTS